MVGEKPVDEGTGPERQGRYHLWLRGTHHEAPAMETLPQGPQSLWAGGTRPTGQGQSSWDPGEGGDRRLRGGCWLAPRPSPAPGAGGAVWVWMKETRGEHPESLVLMVTPPLSRRL